MLPLPSATLRAHPLEETPRPPDLLERGQVLVVPEGLRFGVHVVRVVALRPVAAPLHVGVLADLLRSHLLRVGRERGDGGDDADEEDEQHDDQHGPLRTRVRQRFGEPVLHEERMRRDGGHDQPRDHCERFPATSFAHDDLPKSEDFTA